MKLIAVLLPILLLNVTNIISDQDEGGSHIIGSVDNSCSNEVFAFTNNSFINVSSYPDHVLYNETFVVSGSLFGDIDNNSRFSTGDVLFEDSWMHVIWNPNSSYEFETDVKTNSSGSSFPGGWVISLDADDPDLSSNGDPLESDPGIELILSYPGEWSTNGFDHYNLTENISALLSDQTVGVDDDGDSAVKLYNGVDDDGDGVIDDGAPGIPKVGFAEGFDEELLNGIDDDGDGFIDEDVNAFIQRPATETRIFIEIWHETSLIIDEIDNDIVEIGDQTIIRGTLLDLSNSSTNMSGRKVRIFLGGGPLWETESYISGGISRFEFNIEIPYTILAGPRLLGVRLEGSYDPQVNSFLNSTSVYHTIHVRRPVSVIFYNIDALYDTRWIYHGEELNVTGAIVDKYYFERDRMITGPDPFLSGGNYSNYTFDLQWGDPGDPDHQIFTDNMIMDDHGGFSVPINLTSLGPDIGPVNITINTTFDQHNTLDPLLYYTNTQNTSIYTIRSRTKIDLWVDQNKNGIDDSLEQDSGSQRNTFCIRKDFVDAYGNTYDWNYMRVRGRLIDTGRTDDQTEIGVPDQSVVLFWGFGKTWQKRYEMIADQNGYFEIDIPIDISHPIGPVPIRAVFASDYLTNYYDPSTYADSDGLPFSVVSYTELGLKLEDGPSDTEIIASGRLTDDMGMGLNNKTVDIFRLDGWDGGRITFDNIEMNGSLIDNVKTDGMGDYSIDLPSPLISPVSRSIHYIAHFNGSKEFPYGSEGIRYLPNDAYMPTMTFPVPLVRSVDTAIVLEQRSFVFPRGESTVIRGQLIEMLDGEIDLQRGVPNMTISLYLKQVEDIFKIGTGTTGYSNSQPGQMGYFEIQTTSIPLQLFVGNVEVIFEFKGGQSSDNVFIFLPVTNTTVGEIWTPTMVKEVYFGPVDQDDPPDGKPDLYEDDLEELFFTYQVLDIDGSEPVTYGFVWFNITMGSYRIDLRVLTDIRGRLHVNLTNGLRDSITGEEFNTSDLENGDPLIISVKFVGKQGYLSSSMLIECTFHDRTNTGNEPDDDDDIIVDDDDDDDDNTTDKSSNVPIIIVIGSIGAILILIAVAIIVTRRKPGETDSEE